jgi:hypothetical protein
VTGSVVALGIGAQGAVGSSQQSTSVSAQHVSAKVLGTHVVNVASLPKQSRVRSSGKAQAMPLLSPLGATGLARARADSSLAPQSPVNMSAPTGSAHADTPGGAVTGFEGMTDSATTCSYFGAGCQPPDMAVAANTKTVVQGVNTSVAMYNASTGALLAGFPKSAQAFFGVPAPSPAGCDAAHGNQPFLSDPRAVYDPVTGHYALAILQVENAFGLSPGCTFVSRYWVAVSATKSPTGAWNVYAINTANIIGSPSAADYTQLGFDSEAFFIGGNQFNQAGTAYDGAWTLAIPKKKAETGQALGSVSGFAGYSASDGTATRLLDTVQPVASYGDGAGGPAGEILISSFNESITESKVVLWDFSNALSGQGHGQTLSGVVVNTLAYSQPPLADNFPSCTDCLETIDNRISATPVYMHGNVYATHDSAVSNGSFVNANVLYNVLAPVLSQTSVSGCTLCSTITASTHIVDQNYLVYSGQTDDWFGAIQPDREGNLFVGYEYGSTSFSTSPSSVYNAKRVTSGGFSDGGVFLRQAANATTNSRWGDFEATSFASWNANWVWFATEYAGVGGDWATHVDKVNYQNLSDQ